MKKSLLLLAALFLFSIVSYSQNEVANDFYDLNSVKKIKLTFKQKNWQNILDSLRKNGDNLLVGKAELDGTTYNNVGVRYRGSRSFQVGAKRNPLHIKLNFIDKGQKHQGHKTIKLSSSLRDPSMVREVLGYEIARKYMPAPRANFVEVYINNEYYGLFVNVENVGSEFLKKNFGSKDGTFFKCSPDLDAFAPEGCQKNVFASLVYEEDINCYLAQYELESESGWDDLIQLTQTLNEQPKALEKVLNIDQTLWMLAFNNVLVNLSSYSGRQSQNYYLYKDSSGKFNPIIWDLNLAFGSYKGAVVGSDFRLKQLQELDPLLHIDNKYKPLISNILKFPIYKKMYLSHVRTILYDNFVNEVYKKRAEELQRMIQVPFINDKNRQYGFDDFKNSLTKTIGKMSRIPGIVELMDRRTSFLKKHELLRVIPPEITEVKPLKRGQYASEQIDQFTILATVNKLPKKVKLVYRYDKHSPFMEVKMEDDGKNSDGAANDGIYGVTVGKGEGYIEYYITAENAAIINFEPANYMHQLYEANISELN